jgi:hypothetical protein
MDETRLLQLKEYARIKNDTPYALKTYLQTFDNTQKVFVPLELFPDQVTLLEDYDKHNENITKKYRQAGVTTVTAAWVSKRLQFADPKSPERVLIAANKLDTAVEMATKIKDFLSQWPAWLNVGFDANKNSEKRYKLKNGCEVKAVATSNDALRGYTPTILILDEAAHIEAGEEFWTACMAALSTGGKIILISTPHGFDQIYYTVYEQAIRGDNNFKITELSWIKDPRYAKNLKWIKCDHIVDYILNRNDYDDSEVVLEGPGADEAERLMEEGYKPYSEWYENMAKKFNYNKRMLAQEVECDFLGSGDNVIPPDIRDKILKTMVREPAEKYMGGSLWQWKEPVEGHRYILAADVSRGDSEDASAICIIDFDDREQVVEYIGKIPPDDLASIVYKWGVLYNAFVVVDITGGMGVATSRKLQELGYKNMFIDGINTMNVWEYKQSALEKIPGINFNNKRTQIVAALEEQLRHGFIVHSSRLMNELTTFMYINGRPDHIKGAHDDGIMALSMALYVGDISFTQLLRNENVNKSMMESWTLSERTYDPQKALYSYGQTFDPLGAMAMGGEQPTSIKQYSEYSWLFNKRR